MIYVMSDIHGHLRRFNAVMEQINLQPEDTLYVLGDVVDRHPDGVRILKRIMDMPNAKMLIGNHEYMMLRALGSPYDTYEQLTDLQQAEATRFWYRNGGRVTHQQWKRIRKDLREKIIRYLHTCPLNYDIKINGIHYKLTHAAPIVEFEHFPLTHYQNPTQFAIWKPWQEQDEQHGDYTLVFGHMRTYHYQQNNPMEIWYGDRRIGIDCGCDFPDYVAGQHEIAGRLACLRLNDMQVFYSD